MKKKIVWLVVSCLMALSLVLASCAPAVVKEEEVEEEVVEEVVEEEVVEEVVVKKEMVTNTAGKLVEKPRYGGWITVSQGTPILGFDASSEATGISQQTGPLTHESLLIGDWTKGAMGTGEADWTTGIPKAKWNVPHLVESYEIPDDETIVFHVRPGIHWHDKYPANGRELTAYDLEKCYNRQLYELPSAYMYNYFPPWQKPKSVEATDKYTLVFHCQKGMGNIGPVFEQFANYQQVQCPDEWEEYGDTKDWKTQIGTGPFMMVDYVPMSTATFERNPNYWKYDPLLPDNQLPYVDGVEMLIVLDPSTRLAAFRTGKLDAIGDTGATRLDWEDAESLKETHPDLPQIGALATSPWRIVMRIDTPELPSYDKRVRHALALAIDNPSILEDFYGGHGAILAWPIAPYKEELDFYIPLEELPEHLRKLHEYHPDEARALLVEAGYPDGFKIEVVCKAMYVDMLSIVAAYWSDIGVDMDIAVKEAGVWSTIGNQRTHQDAIVRPLGSVGNAHKLYVWKPGNRFNNSFLDDPYFNDLIARLDAAYFDLDEHIRLKKTELIPYVLDECWAVTPPTPYQYGSWWPWVKAYHGESILGYYSHENTCRAYVWLDQELKKEMGY